VAEKKKDINARSNRYKRRGNEESEAEESKAEHSVRKQVTVVVPIEEYLIHEVCGNPHN
jgi:F0F1-type ATP synthase membrane subunit b/b'